MNNDDQIYIRVLALCTVNSLLKWRKPAPIVFVIRVVSNIVDYKQ